MKKQIQTLILNSLNKLNIDTINAKISDISIVVEHTRDKKFGDFASNIAMILAKPAKMNPRDLAAKIIEHLESSAIVLKVEIAGPGFINFYIAADARSHVLKDILTQKEKFGVNRSLSDRKIHMEFVSANPTGPLHVGHGRSAAFGSALSNLLRANGVDLHTEYYVNDAGRQMDILATSVWLRYLELNALTFPFPSNGYKGDYVIDIAQTLHEKYQGKFITTVDLLFAQVPTDLTEDTPDGDKEAHIDGLIYNAKKLLTPENYDIFFNQAIENILTLT